MIKERLAHKWQLTGPVFPQTTLVIGWLLDYLEVQTLRYKLFFCAGRIYKADEQINMEKQTVATKLDPTELGANDTKDASNTNEGASELVRAETSGHIRVLKLNAPHRRNCLSLAMLGALQDAFDAAGNDANIRAIVLGAEGPVFCAGHDLKELTSHRAGADKGRAHFVEVMGKCAEVMQTIVRGPKPVIAAVQGTATAAGCQLVASTDLAVTVDHAKFCTPGVNIGLFCSTPMVALSRNVSRKRAMEMLLLGEMINAEDAAEYGLVNRVVKPEEMFAEAMAMAQKIAEKSPVTVAIGKQAFYNQLELGLSDAYDYAADVMVANMLERDAEEGIGAFIEKRAPVWGKGEQS